MFQNQLELLRADKPVDFQNSDMLEKIAKPVIELSEKEFVKLVDDFLSGLAEHLEDVMDFNAEIEDINYSSGVLKLELVGNKSYVLNKQTPNKQLWLSSPFSGPQRYEYNSPRKSWVNNRSGVDIIELLNSEFKSNFKDLQLKLKQ